MQKSSTELAGQALESLVSQFSSSLDCLRELVQNSMDAGTPQVDVWLDFEPPEAGQPTGEGVITVHVDDFGAGMDEPIIDNELTRLFASSKEGDLTKIGKFGIGFVSIFALGPQAVLLHTGRGGQYWEVFFYPDRTFSKTAVATPVEGTQITLFLTGDETRYLHIVREARSTLKRWCRHSDVEITFEDRSGLTAPQVEDRAGPELINEPFELPGLLSVQVEVEGTQMSLCHDPRPTYSFFNKGLTLAELRDPDEVPARLAHIAFKIKSRYLEHTLSRETVLRDENYEKAMRLLLEAASGPLHEALLEAIEGLVAQPRWGLAEEERYGQLIAALVREPGEAIRAARRRSLLRTVEGGATSLAAVAAAARRQGWIFTSDQPSGLTSDLAAADSAVLFSRWRPGSEQAPQGDAKDEPSHMEPKGSEPGKLTPTGLPAALRLVVAFVADAERSRPLHILASLFTSRDYGTRVSSMLARPEEVFWSIRVDEDSAGPSAGPSPAGEDSVLISRAEKLLAQVGAGFKRLRGGVLTAQPAKPPLFVVAERIGRRMAIPPPFAPAEERPSRPEAVVNREHPHYRMLLRLHRRAPGLAAYALAKSLLLAEDRLLERDLELLGHSLEEFEGVPCRWRTP